MMIKNKSKNHNDFFPIPYFKEKYNNEYEDYLNSFRKEKLFQMIFEKENKIILKRNEIHFKVSKFLHLPNTKKKLEIDNVEKKGNDIRKNFFKMEKVDLHKKFCNLLEKQNSKIPYYKIKIKSKSFDVFF